METAELMITDLAQVPVAIGYDDFKIKVATAAQQCQAIEIVDESSLTIGKGIITMGSKLSKAIKDKGKLLKTAPKEVINAIDRYIETLTTDLDQAVADGKAKVLAYSEAEKKRKADALEEIERKRQEALRRENEEKARITRITTWISDYENKAIEAVNKCDTPLQLADVYKTFIKHFPGDDFFHEFLSQAKAALERVKIAGKQRKLYVDQLELQQSEEHARKLQEAETQRQKDAVAKAEQGKEDLQEAAEEKNKLAEMDKGMTEAKLASQEIDISGQKVPGVTKRWIFEIVDLSVVPRQWLCVDEKVVKEYLSANKEVLRDGEVINGIKFFQSEGVTLR